MKSVNPHRKYSVALVLGGGAARGMAHIGVLKVFEQNHITFDLVVGTSIGSLVGAAYALRTPLEHLESLALATTARDLFDFSFSRMGLIGGLELSKIVRKTVENREFSDVKIPLAIVTTDIEKAEEVVYTDGNLVQLICASCSYPGIFCPIKVGERLLVDGGIKNSVPVSVARKMGAKLIIAVDVGFCVRKAKFTNVIQLMFQAYQILGEEMSNYQALAASMVIKPQLNDIDQFAFHRAREAIDKGEEAARAALPQLITMLKQGGYLPRL